jgi:hypothetical protein
MTRHLLFVLLLATGFALAADRPAAKHATGAAKSQAKTKAVQGRTEPMQARTETAPKQAEVAQAKTEAAQGQTEHAQAATEETPGKTGEAPANTEEKQPEKDAELVSVPGGKALGMSILGNQEAPKSLVIVPWKSSELGASPGISPMLDDSRQPVDKEVFMRALRYYEIRSETKP